MHARSGISRIVQLAVVALCVSTASCGGLGDIGAPTTTTELADSAFADSPASTEGTVVSVDPALQPGPTADLEQAIRSAADVNGPFGYVTLVPLCPDCGDAQEVQLYLAPSAADANLRDVRQAFVGGEEVVPDAIWAIDPVQVPGMLIQAMDEGKAVAWTIDPGTFLVRSWTIDGEGASYDCYEVDTASVDLRSIDCSGGMLGRG